MDQGHSENKNVIKDILNNKLVRIILALLFFLFLYKIIYNTLIFFYVNENIVQMYMTWIAVFILVLSILPTERYGLILKN